MDRRLRCCACGTATRSRPTRCLLAAAAESKNKDNADGLRRLCRAPEHVRISLLRAVFILDGSPNIIDVRDEIERELYHAAPRDQIDHFVERLEGWWFGTVIRR